MLLIFQGINIANQVRNTTLCFNKGAAYGNKNEKSSLKKLIFNTALYLRMPCVQLWNNMEVVLMFLL